MSEEVAVRDEAEEGAPLWVVTFGDLMSLLLCFFVLMLSFSEQDRKKYRMVSGSMNRAFGIQRKTPVFESPKGQKMIAKEFDQAILIAKIEHEFMDPITQEKLKRIENAKDLFEIEATEEEVTIRLMGETTFDLGRAQRRPLQIQFRFIHCPGRIRSAAFPRKTAYRARQNFSNGFR